jgi:hypothetical protein
MATRTISDAGGNWTATTTWVEGVVPTNADDVVATATSGALAIVAGAVCRSFDLTGYTKTLTGSAALTIGGSTGGPGDAILKVPAAGFTHSFTSGYVLATSAPAPQTVNVLRALGAPVTINGTGTVQLAANFSLGSQSLTHTAGTFDVNGRTLTVGQLFCSGAVARTLTFGTATVFINTVGGLSFDVSGSNYTISAASATFTMNSGSGFQGGGAIYGTVAWAAVSGTQSPGITGSNTFTNLTFGPGTSGTPEIHFQGGTTQTITGTFSVAGSATFRTKVATGNNNFTGTVTAGSLVTINLGTTGSATLAHAHLMDVAIVGTNTPVTGTRLGNALGNSGITFDAPRTLYWVGNSGTWLDATKVHWALTSGGTPSAAVPYPLPQDDVVIDSNSFTLANQTITCDERWLCRNFTVGTTPTGCQATASGALVSFFGDVRIPDATQFKFDEIFYARTRSTSTHLRDSNSTNAKLYVQAPGGTVSLVDDLEVNEIRLYAGTFDSAGHNVTLQTFDADITGGMVAYQRELRMGSGLWTLLDGTTTGWDNGQSATLYTLAPGTASLLITGTPPTNTQVLAVSRTMPPIIIDLPAAKNVNLSGAFSDITQVSGTATVTAASNCTSLASTGDQARTFAISASAILTVVGPITFSGTNLTLTPNTSTLTCAPTTLETDIRTNGLTFATMTLRPPIGGEITVFGGGTASAVTIISPAGPTTVSFNESVLVTGRFTATGNSAVDRLRVFGPAWGGTATLTAAQTTLGNVDLTNIVQAGAAAWTGTSKTNSFTGWNNQAIGA